MVGGVRIRMSDDKNEDNRLEQYRRAFVLQMFRLAAVVGAFLGETVTLWVAFGLAAFLDHVIGLSFVMTIRGYQIPIFAAAQVVIAVEIFRGAASIYLQENPEFRGIEEE